MAASASMPPTPSEHAEAIDHCGMGVCPDEGVWEGELFPIDSGMPDGFR